MKVRLVALISLCLFGPGLALADDPSYPTENIYPAAQVDDAEVSANVEFILNVYYLIRGGEYGKPRSGGSYEIDFYFASGDGYIRNQRVSRDALSLFEGEASAEILQLPINTDVCYVQDFRVNGTQRITLAVHNEDHNGADDVYRCLIAGLWWYSFDSLDGFDSDDWRTSFYRLF